MFPVGLVGRRVPGRIDVFVCEAEADHAPGPAAVEGSVEDLLARIGDVACESELRRSINWLVSQSLLSCGGMRVR